VRELERLPQVLVGDLDVLVQAEKTPPLFIWLWELPDHQPAASSWRRAHA
jgi:hypothetical protein